MKYNATSFFNEQTQLPNKALLSLIILLGTCFIAVALKRFRRSKFFGRTVRIDGRQYLTLYCLLVETNIERFRHDNCSDLHGAIRYVRY
jgi:hypothetical protein